VTVKCVGMYVCRYVCMDAAGNFCRADKKITAESIWLKFNIVRLDLIYDCFAKFHLNRIISFKDTAD
jgi:hypothetical protein